MKKQNIFFLSIFCSLLLGCATLLGCSSSQTPTGTNSTTATAAPEAGSEEIAAPEAPVPSMDVESRTIAVTILNLSSVNAGMFSVLDPVLNTQADISALAPEGTLSFDYNSPLTKNEFQWAVYDTDGELIIESSTDISTCEKKLSIILSGTDTIDDVDVFFD